MAAPLPGGILKRHQPAKNNAGMAWLRLRRVARALTTYYLLWVPAAPGGYEKRKASANISSGIERSKAYQCGGVK